MAAGGRAYFPYISIYKTLKIFFSETNGPISIQLGRNVSLVTLYKDCSGRHDSSKNMAARGRGLFSLYIYIENFKNLLVRNSWIEFSVTWQECCFGTFYQDCSSLHDTSKTMAPSGVGLIFHIYLHRKFLNSSCHIPHDQFQYYLAGMLLWWTSIKIVQAIMIRQKTWLPWGGACFPYISK